ncbi:hypothetical protein FQA47_010235 [Oryzias melastigma]|uniref:Transcription factor AP-2 C-terminal domain-containing protein n=1 Tax=Oryzias melastigma TaxID=30732 RepID=A0A834C0M5_ORYME|nr:hypothetical protein FQA47_010235 [Oryzias melastigma]
MDPSTGMMGLGAQGNMVFTVVKPVMGIFQVSSEQGSGVPQGCMGLQSLSENTIVLPPAHSSQGPLDPNQLEMQSIHSDNQIQVSVLTEDPSHSHELGQNAGPNAQPSSQVPFAEVSSLLDPNMKGSKARTYSPLSKYLKVNCNAAQLTCSSWSGKYLISYEEIKRRLQAPEKMSLRSLAAYTRVSRGPASKKTLLESLNVLGLTPSTTTSVSSSFSKLTEGDTRTLCEDMKDFAHDYIDYGNMAKQLIPETNTVQHWSKLIETKNHLEEMRKCFKDPVNSGAFENVTHGLGLGMLDVALDMIVMVIDQQIRILSGAAASDPADSTQPVRRIRRRHRKACSSEKPHTASGGTRDQGKSAAKAKTRVRARKKIKPDSGLAGPSETQAGPDKPDSEETNVLTFVSVGYEAVTGGLNAAQTV